MTVIPFSSGLHRLGRDTYAYLQPPGTWGFSNCGVIVDGDQALLVDTQFDLPRTQALIDTLTTQLPGTRVATVVTTHANGDHCWGNQLFADAEIIGSAATAHEMAHEVSPEALRQLSGPDAPDGTLGDYMRRHFGCFDFSGIALTPPTRTFTGQLDVRVGGRIVELAEVGPAHTDGDVIVHAPDAGVVFTGDILFIGDHPIMWTGPVENWLAACDRIEKTGARYVVPGHGPVTDLAGVRQFRRYLEYVADQAHRRYEAGTPYWQAAADMPLPERYRGWGHRERLVITVAALYRQLGAPPAPLMEVLAHTAAAEQRAPAG
ncbi:MBL fold metallo-hydrolase [Krasilnikovia sp. MM14-A1259]|uniref:MBL fold metallo-hydrolase n=1 Tax=Krasilnikovia sp. MM14-A1259 TaxID=3373539 RepID=UPI0038129694